MNAPTSEPYAGPLVVLTVAEADRIVSLLRGRPNLADLVTRLERAVTADPTWRLPIR